MDTLLTNFALDRPTWFYLSCLLIVALFFRFNRVFSLRNLDLALLLSLTPGLLLVEQGYLTGYVVLLSAAGVILIRLFADSRLRKRPRFPQNLNTAGLTFLAVVCGLFHVTEIAKTSQLPETTVRAGDLAARLIQRHDTRRVASDTYVDDSQSLPIGPAAAVLSAPIVGASEMLLGKTLADALDVPMRIACIFAHLGIVTGLVILGWRVFSDLALGIAMAALYLMLPYTAYDVDQIYHVLPGALILWAAVCMRNPWLAGGLMGLACGTLFFPVFLLPIWISFYGVRNASRFAIALASVWILLLGSIALTSTGIGAFVAQLITFIDASFFDFSGVGRSGIWTGAHGVWRMPVFAVFVIMVGLLCWWPKKRTLEQLLMRLAAVIVGIQFWYPHQGGIYLLWFAPLLIAIIFRPVIAHCISPPALAWPWEKSERTEPAIEAIPQVKRAVSSSNSRSFTSLPLDLP